MDLPALRAANQIVRNAPDEAALEIHSPVVLQTDAPHLIALTGADARFEINGRASADVDERFCARERNHRSRAESARGDGFILRFTAGLTCRASWEASQLFCAASLEDWKDARSRQEIKFQSARNPSAIWLRRRDAVRINAHIIESEIRVILGPHHDWFAPEAIAALTRDEVYVVTETADRMGYRLRGNALAGTRT